MMKIKRKVQKTLPQLIEWGFNNPKEVESKIFESDNIDYFSNTAHVQFSNDGCGVRMSSSVTVNDTFTVTTEEEITEDTVLSKLTCYTAFGFKGTKYNISINDVKSHNPLAFYIMNDDLTMTLIWTHEKGLVE